MSPLVINISVDSSLYDRPDLKSIAPLRLLASTMLKPKRVVFAIQRWTIVQIFRIVCGCKDVILFYFSYDKS